MITITITDAQQSQSFETLIQPLVDTPVLNEGDVTTIEGDIATYYTGNKKRNISVLFGYMTTDAYAVLEGFRDRQRTNHAYPLITINGADGLAVDNLPCKMTLSAQSIVDNCGTVENVRVTLRESVQMS